MGGKRGEVWAEFHVHYLSIISQGIGLFPRILDVPIVRVADVYGEDYVFTLNIVGFVWHYFNVHGTWTSFNLRELKRYDYNGGK